VIAAGAEVDAFQLAALRDHADDPDGMTAAGRTREAVYSDWLAERLRGAATLEDARLAAFLRTRAMRPGRGSERRAARVEGPDAVIQGTLAVEDPEAFAVRLAQGVGRHLAWGYGMLLLRPPSQADGPC
jgi:CRISPR system Cascade subunit CasE